MLKQSTDSLDRMLYTLSAFFLSSFSYISTMELTMNETTFSLRALKDSSNLVSSFWTMLPSSNSVSFLLFWIFSANTDWTFSVLFWTMLLNVIPLTTKLFWSFSCLALALSAWTFICSLNFGHSLEEATCSPLQLEHFSLRLSLFLSGHSIDLWAPAHRRHFCNL